MGMMKICLNFESIHNFKAISLTSFRYIFVFYIQKPNFLIVVILLSSHPFFPSFHVNSTNVSTIFLPFFTIYITYKRKDG